MHPSPFESPFPSWAGFGTVAAWEPDRGEPHEEELALLSPTAVAERRLTFELGRAAARRALLLVGCVGSPVLRAADGAPLWPAGFVGSISHTSDRAVAAAARASRCAGLGLDLEDVRRVRSDSIARLVADAEEQRWIAGDPARLIQIFSAKEAIFKAFHPRHGAFFGFDAVSLEPRADGFVATLRIALSDWPAGSTCTVRSQRHADHVLSSVLVPIR